MSLKSVSHGPWAFICGGAVGVLIAFPLAAPVFDGKILEPVATTWGSALGAIAAVAGAYWVAGWQASQQRRAGGALVHALFYPVASGLKDLITLYRPESRRQGGESIGEAVILSADDWQKIAKKAERVIELHSIFKSRIHRYEAALNLLSAGDLHVTLDLETELEEIISGPVTDLTARPQFYDVATSRVNFINAAPNPERDYALMEGNIRVQSYLALLERNVT